MKTIFLGAAMSVLPVLSYACDVCGCSIAGGGFGLISGTTRHFVGVSYSHLGYNNIRSPVRDRLHRWQLAGQASLGRHWRITATVPVHYNLRLDKRTSSLSTSGLGDIGATLSYSLLDHRTEKGGQILLFGGAGTQAPTGKFDPVIFRRNLPEDFNPGRGTWTPHVLFRGQFTEGLWGVLAKAYYEKPLSNGAGYNYGSRLNMQAIALRRFATPWAGIVSTAGVDYLSVDESIRAESKTPLHGSGGQLITSRLGFQLERNDFTLALETAIPLYSKFAENATKAVVGSEITLLKKL